MDSIQQIFPGDMLQSLSEDDEDPSGSDGEDGENNDEGADSEDDASEPLDNVSDAHTLSSSPTITLNSPYASTLTTAVRSCSCSN